MFLTRAHAVLQVDHEVAEAVESSNRNKRSTHVDARLMDSRVPVALDGLTLEERQEQASDSVQDNEDTQSPAEDLV
jgi:hypothetical protein